jgi:hypothetical protein
VISLIGALSIVCFLVAVIMLLHLIQTVFAQEGVVWGFLSILYPPGTYLLCRNKWDLYGPAFVRISIFLGIGFALWVILKLLP